MAELRLTEGTTKKKITIHPVNEDGRTVNPNINLLPLTILEQVIDTVTGTEMSLEPVRENLCLSKSDGHDVYPIFDHALTPNGNRFLYIYDQSENNGNNGKKISIDKLDYSKITVTSDDNVTNIREKDFIFKKDN